MRRAWVVLVAVVFAVLAVECRPHPLSAARDMKGYRGKAGTTVESALGEVETIRVTINARTLNTYAAQTIGDAEESLRGLADTFDSIQPPRGGDQLRTQVDQLLQRAIDRATDIRVAVRRGERPRDTLAEDVRELSAFKKANESQ